MLRLHKLKQRLRKAHRINLKIISTLVPTVRGGNAYRIIFKTRSAFPRRSVGTCKNNEYTGNPQRYILHQRAISLMITPTAPPLADEPSLVDLLQTLWFRRRLLFSTALFIIAVGVTVVFHIVPRYTASSGMMIGVPKTDQVYIEQVMEAGFESGTAIASEVEVLCSGACRETD